MRCNESGRIDNRCGRHWSRSFRCRSSTCIATAIRLCTAVRLSDFASVVTATLGAREDSVEKTELADLATKRAAAARLSCTARLCTTFWLCATFWFSAAFGLSDFASVIAHSITNAQADFRNVDLDQRLAAARIALSTARGFCTTLRLCTTIWLCTTIRLCTAIWLSDFASVFSRFAALSITTTT